MVELGIGAVVLLAFLWFLQVRTQPARLIVRRDCENRYADARTSGDSSGVDRMPLIIPPRDSLAARTCGQLLRGAAP